MEPLEQDIERKLSVVLERAVMTPPQDAVRWATVTRELTEALVMLRQQRLLEVEDVPTGVDAPGPGDYERGVMEHERVLDEVYGEQGHAKTMLRVEGADDDR